MIQITQDPVNPDRLIISSTVTLFLEKVALQALSSEIEAAVKAQAIKDLEGNEEVKKVIAAAATQKLLGMLGVTPTPEKLTDIQQFRKSTEA